MSNRPWIIAHRGASFDAPENTLAAFAEAWQQQADGIEGDYCFTLDEQIVCIHDDDTQRTSGQNLIVAQSRLSDLRNLEYGSWKSEQFRGQKLPLLQEVLAQFSLYQPDQRWCVLELKTGPEIVPMLRSELVRWGGDWTRLLVIAFDQRTVFACKEIMPQLRVHWLTDYHQDGNGDWRPSAKEVVEQLQQSQADGLGTENNQAAVTPEFIQHLRHEGYGEFHVWTVDDPNQAAYYAQLGAWGLTTNRPGYLRRSLGW